MHQIVLVVAILNLIAIMIAIIKLSKVIQGQRLSTIIRIEPATMKIFPKEFLPKKDLLKKKVLEAFQDEKHPCPDTLAFCILNHSGFNGFVEGSTRQNIQRALARLLVNEDEKQIRKDRKSVV